MISKYSEFILESQIYNLILEGKMVFSSDFIEILDTLSTSGDAEVEDLSSLIRGYMNIDVAIDSNCIDVSDKQGMISFVPDDKVSEEDLIYKIKPTVDLLDYNSNDPHSLFTELDIPGEGLINIHPRSLTFNRWKIIKKQNLDTYNNLTFYYLQDVDTPSRFIVIYYAKAAQPLIPIGTTSNRKGDVKLGRFINKFLSAIGKNFNAATIERLVNMYQAEVLLKKNALNYFKVVEGEDIRKWYHENMYESSNGGQLANSCMRYPKCQDFLDIYTENPQVCKLLIFTPNEGKLSGRALLWTLENGKKYMDRIYTNKDSYDNLFLKWANENGYTKGIEASSVVKVNTKDYELYPYMDTFIYYDADEGKLSNSEIFQRPYAQLDETDGEPDWRT
jgi:hypothetical protein